MRCFLFGDRVLVDYASPNMSKALHVGHMRTILIGDCVARILELLGHQVDSVRYVRMCVRAIMYVCMIITSPYLLRH